MKKTRVFHQLHLVVAEKKVLSPYYFALRHLLYMLHLQGEYILGDEGNWRTEWGAIYCQTAAILSHPNQGVVLQSTEFQSKELRRLFINLAKEQGVPVICWYSHPYPDIPTPEAPSYDEGFRNIFFLDEKGALIRPQFGSWGKVRKEPRILYNF